MLQWPPRVCVLRNQFNRLWDFHTFNGPAASRLAGPCNIRVILSFSFKTCGPTNTTPETSICSPNRRIRAMHDPSSPISVLSLPYSPIQLFSLVFRTCYHHRGCFRSFFEGVPLLDPWLAPLLWDGLSLLMKPFLARLIYHTSFTCDCYILACSVLPLFCVWLLPCPFPSDVPGQYRRAFITNV